MSSTIYGYPRIGSQRELKRATESYWRGKSTREEMLAVAGNLRRDTWQALRDAGIDEIPSNTFSFYDHMLDMIQLVDAVPDRYHGKDDLDTYFAMARGTDDVAPLEMTKWFDTNYHYLVPELSEKTSFRLAGTKPFDEFGEARSLGIITRPVLVGPITFLLLAKNADESTRDFQPLDLLDSLVDVYVEILAKLAEQGAEWVQVDEPALVQDQPPAVLAATARAYKRLGALTERPNILVATYFGSLGDALPVLTAAPIEGIGIDFTERGGDNLEQLRLIGGIGEKRLVAGVVDGRNVWVNDLTKSIKQLTSLSTLTNDLIVAPSCSLLHVPIDVETEADIDLEIRPWLAFARQKLDETVTLSLGVNNGIGSITEKLETNNAIIAARASSSHTSNADVRKRMGALGEQHHRRGNTYEHRSTVQAQELSLPVLPTTTIGSFPQTAELRQARAALGKGTLNSAEYQQRIRDEIAHVVRLQESIGLDVLVHGEAERNDMVQYFAEQLDGFVATQHGWVQSYGTRYVRPPIIAGDVSRPRPMTVEWSTYAQSLTQQPMKGMLTGPVTMLCWSFVRDDQPWVETARQVALALRDEVNDLERAGIRVIQVDEPALREGLPLRSARHREYLDGATEAFRLSTSGVEDKTQIHTHMCYAEFGQILDAVAALDADVISLEAARSRMEITEELASFGYAAEVGPGVYDIHSPRIPSVEEMTDLLMQAGKTVDARRLWVNPDCGLKTRTEAEVVPR